MNIAPAYFVANNTLRNKIINIISNLLSPPIAYNGAQKPCYNYPQSIADRYNHMLTHLNKVNCNKEGYIDGKVCSCIKNNSLLENENLLAGLDLPVWIGPYDGSTSRIMILSQDPRRSLAEMAGHNPCIALSSPFGWHDYSWRANKRTGLLPQICYNLITSKAKEGEKICFYFTDLYKFRKANTSKNKDNSVIDKVNLSYYINIVKQEIEAFNPTHIIFMGGAVLNTPLYNQPTGKRSNSNYFTNPVYSTAFPAIKISAIMHISSYGKPISEIIKSSKWGKNKYEVFYNYLASII